MEIYTDASFDEKRGVAGIGLLIRKGAKQTNISNWIPAPDNNYAELWAIYMASILMSGRDGVIYTDSQTALSYIKNEIKEKPRTKEQYERHQRMRLLAYKVRKLNPKVEKVKGHESKYQEKPLSNNMADLLAKFGRSKYYGLTK